MIAERWHQWLDPEDRLDDIKRRFEDDCPDADRVVRFELRVTPRFGRWLHEHPIMKPRRVPFLGGVMCDNVRLGVLRGDSSERARLVAFADTGREIPVAVITTQ